MLDFLFINIQQHLPIAKPYVCFWYPYRWLTSVPCIYPSKEDRRIEFLHGQTRLYVWR